MSDTDRELPHALSASSAAISPTVRLGSSAFSGLANPVEAAARVESCQALVRSLAWQVSRNMPSHIDLDDLIGEGQLGLMRAVRDYSPDRGAQFATYAYWRIRGAMLDWGRSQRWFAQGESTDATADGETTAVTQSSGTRRNVSASVDVTAIAAPDDESPSNRVSEGEIKEMLRAMIGKLDGRSRQILELTVLDDKTLEQAGKTAGVHKGTAQRLQSGALKELATALRTAGLLDVDGDQLREMTLKGRARERRKSR